MDLGIRDKVALVTGASRNIGRGIATALAAEGARLILVARGVEGLEELRKKISTPQSQHHCYAIDLMAPGGVEKLVESVRKDFGAPDIMVHNLGGSFMVTDPFAPAADWRNVWQYNVGIGHELNRAFIPEMVKKKWGRIVHLSTNSTKTGHGYAPSVSSKFAIDGYVSTVNRAVAEHNVVICAIAPGTIRSEGRFFAKMEDTGDPDGKLKAYMERYVPARKLGTAENVGCVVTFLCSEHAWYMSGSIVRVDGGGM